MIRQNAIIMTSRELYTLIIDNPEGVEFDGDPIIICDGILFLAMSNILWLPKRLIVMGDLNIEGCHKLQELPANLYVGGNLHMSGSKVKKIPADINVRGDIFAEDMDLDFPDIFAANRGLYLTGKTDSPNTSRLRLPKEELFVHDVLDIRNRTIVECSKHIVLEGSLLANDIDEVISKRLHFIDSARKPLLISRYGLYDGF